MTRSTPVSQSLLPKLAPDWRTRRVMLLSEPRSVMLPRACSTSTVEATCLRRVAAWGGWWGGVRRRGSSSVAVATPLAKEERLSSRETQLAELWRYGVPATLREVGLGRGARGCACGAQVASVAVVRGLYDVGVKGGVDDLQPAFHREEAAAAAQRGVARDGARLERQRALPLVRDG